MNEVLASARKIYLDANIIIYFLEGESTFQDKVERIFEFASEDDIPLISSELSIAECLYGTHRFGRGDLAGKYESIFQDPEIIHLVPIEIEICRAAAEIGARNRLKLIDAIHVASAIATGCDTFITNDKGIRIADSLRIVQLSDL